MAFDTIEVACRDERGNRISFVVYDAALQSVVDSAHSALKQHNRVSDLAAFQLPLTPTKQAPRSDSAVAGTDRTATDIGD